MADENMSKPMPPCTKECEGRAPGCATSCKKWAAYEEARNAYYDERVKLRNANDTDAGTMRTLRRVERDRRMGYRKTK